MRCRTRHLKIQHSLGTTNIKLAKTRAKEYLDREGDKLLKDPCPAGLNDPLLDRVAEIYATLSLGCNQVTAKHNVACLSLLVRTATGKELHQVRLSALAAAWPAFVAKRQDTDQPDRPDHGKPNYNRKRVAHNGICSVMTQARSIFIKSLHPQYREAGIIMPPLVDVVKFPSRRRTEPAPVDESRLLAAWPELRESDALKWRIVGLAWFGGLRKKEILACKGGWFIQKDGEVFVSLKDREDEGHEGKTGAIYKSPIRNPEFAAYLLTVPADQPVVGLISQGCYRSAMIWLRQFTNARTPAHRLRGRHAQAIKEETQAEELARLKGIQAAADALGHGKNTQTTIDHYLEPENVIRMA
jgi:hypothetical protein